ncbi:MAG: hypothetical protein HYX87_08055 [Chloroflexi bacterium]|nr:hypothetical protein [Chloroflexota bacterium]
MIRYLHRIVKGNEGQIFPLVLILLLVGGLVVVPGLSYASTAINGGKITERNVKGLYAADSGVEHAIWKLKNSPPELFPHLYQLTGINGSTVDIRIDQMTQIYGLAIGSPGVHSDYLAVETSLVYDAPAQNWLYTVTIINKDTSTIHLDKVVVKIPEQFQYIPGTTSGDLTVADPSTITGDIETGMMLDWDFETPRPMIPAGPNPPAGQYGSATHIFRLSAPESYAGDNGYIWVVAEREDIGAVGGILYQITSQAVESGRTVAKIKAGILKDPDTGSVVITHWDINPVLGD